MPKMFFPNLLHVMFNFSMYSLFFKKQEIMYNNSVGQRVIKATIKYGRKLIRYRIIHSKNLNIVEI